MAKIIALLSLIAILILGNQLRSFSYDSVPHPGETTDEYDFAWAGLSLIKHGIPEGWSYVKNAYSNVKPERINVDNLFDKEPSRPPFTMVKPWFDKPPGLALLIGGYAYVKGAKEFYQTGVGIIRRPMLKIAIITTILIFILATRLYGYTVGLLSALLYSTIPTTVISSRLTLAENGYIPLYIGALIFVDVYLVRKKYIFLYLAAILAALGIIFKLSAISVLLSLLLILLFYLHPKERFMALGKTFAIGIIGFLLFVLYGAYLDWETFWKVFWSQSNFIYGAGAEVFYSAVVSSRITATKFFTDGWILLGWISMLLISFIEWKREKGGTFLTIAVISYLITFLIFGSESYGWYRFPFLPFLVISIARIFQILYQRNNLFVFLALFLIPFGTTVHKLIGMEGFQNYVPQFRTFALFCGILFTYLIAKNNETSRKITKIFMLLAILILVFLSIKEIYFYTYDKWFFVT